MVTYTSSVLYIFELDQSSRDNNILLFISIYLYKNKKSRTHSFDSWFDVFIYTHYIPKA